MPLWVVWSLLRVSTSVHRGQSGTQHTWVDLCTSSSPRSNGENDWWVSYVVRGRDPHPRNPVRRREGWSGWGWAPSILCDPSMDLVFTYFTSKGGHVTCYCGEVLWRPVRSGRGAEVGPGTVPSSRGCPWYPTPSGQSRVLRLPSPLPSVFG